MKKPDGLTETEWLQYQSWAEELTATWPFVDHTNILTFFLSTEVEADKQELAAEKAERDWYNKA